MAQYNIIGNVTVRDAADTDDDDDDDDGGGDNNEGVENRWSEGKMAGTIIGSILGGALLIAGATLSYKALGTWHTVFKRATMSRRGYTDVYTAGLNDWNSQ